MIMASTFIAFIIGMILIVISSCVSDVGHSPVECKNGTYEVVADCKDPNEVLCACESVDGEYIYIDTVVHHAEHTIMCNSECESYQ